MDDGSARIVESEVVPWPGTFVIDPPLNVRADERIEQELLVDGTLRIRNTATGEERIAHRK